MVIYVYVFTFTYACVQLCVSVCRDLHESQKRPIWITKETYMNHKRDLYESYFHMRVYNDVSVCAETYMNHKRDLYES